MTFFYFNPERIEKRMIASDFRSSSGLTSITYDVYSAEYSQESEFRVEI